ncbi:hypothetical protein T484DRAFT_1758484 [Baffinella frigidus]|nr:hypothetical protein T484DRAFT_1758484 [Cryptophyta sp. CCMP2293]
MFITTGYRRKRLIMDRSRYYPPEELFDKSDKYWQYGLSLEFAPGLYETIDSKQVLHFVCEIVSKYHVNLHDEDEIDVELHRVGQVEHDNITQSFLDTATEVQIPEVVSDDDHEHAYVSSILHEYQLQVSGCYTEKLSAKNRKCNTQNKQKVDLHGYLDDVSDGHGLEGNPTSDNEL